MENVQMNCIEKVLSLSMYTIYDSPCYKELQPEILIVDVTSKCCQHMDNIITVALCSLISLQISGYLLAMLNIVSSGNDHSMFSTSYQWLFYGGGEVSKLWKSQQILVWLGTKEIRFMNCLAKQLDASRSTDFVPVFSWNYSKMQ